MSTLNYESLCYLSGELAQIQGTLLALHHIVQNTELDAVDIHLLSATDAAQHAIDEIRNHIQQLAGSGEGE